MMLDFCESLYMYVWLIEIMKGTLRRYYISIHFCVQCIIQNGP